MRTFIVILACVGLAASAEFRSKIRSRRQGFTLSFGNTGGSGSSCTDSRSDCASYGKSMCSDTKYQQWVTDNCCAYCQMGAAPQMTQAPAIPMVNSGGSGCMDKVSNCAAYTQSVCTNSDYSQWVTENCPKFCNKCSSSGGSGGTVFQPATFAPAPMVSGSSCMDKVSNCAAYTQSVCTNSDYSQWVTENCPKFCNKCSSGGTVFQPATFAPAPVSGGSTCVDKQADCASYGQSVCTNSDYTQWVKDNCPKFCNQCGGSTGGNPAPVVTNPVSGGTCADVSSNCAVLNQASHICSDAGAKIYAQQNCARTCNMCSSGGSGGSPMISPGGNTGGTTTCVDKLSNCALYGQDMCSNSDYTQWAQENCAKFCGRCTSSSGSVPMPSGGSTGGGGGTITGSSSGCYYKSKLHQQGETWQDACQYDCTCIDGATGKYSCTDLCVTWNLPDVCHMNPPQAGKCCSTPSCPAGYDIKYPPNYTPKVRSMIFHLVNTERSISIVAAPLVEILR